MCNIWATHRLLRMWGVCTPVRSRTGVGGAAVDRAIPPPSAEQRPTGQSDLLYAGRHAQMFGHLVPENRWLRLFGYGIESENAFGREADGPIGQAVESCSEKSGHEKYDKTKRHLRRDQGMHQSTL